MIENLPPEWTLAPPTEPGRYWYMPVAGMTPQLVVVRYLAPGNPLSPLVMEPVGAEPTEEGPFVVDRRRLAGRVMGWWRRAAG